MNQTLSRSLLLVYLIFGSIFSNLVFATSQQDPSTAWRKINNGAMLIDVRSSKEFHTGHLQYALNIPYQQIVQILNSRNLSKNKEIVVYCRSGNRSNLAREMLIKAGYNNIYDAGALHALKKQQELTR